MTGPAGKKIKLDEKETNAVNSNLNDTSSYEKQQNVTINAENISTAQVSFGPPTRQVFPNEVITHTREIFPQEIPMEPVDCGATYIPAVNEFANFKVFVVFVVFYKLYFHICAARNFLSP